MSIPWNSIFLLAISLAAGYGLMCEKCENRNGDTCSGPLENCGPSVYSCLSTLIVVIHGSQNFSQITKSCAVDSNMCYATYNMSLGPLLLYSNARCCQEDGCNRGNIIMPPVNLTENGVECPSAYENGTSSDPPSTTKCTGTQTRCYSFSGGILEGNCFVDIVAKGCAVEEVCLYPAPSYPSSHLKPGYNMTCS